jgi:glycosyltransferase involved in cell wall biosynthesis
MKVSVVITTHNRPTQVVRALQSVLNQSKLPDEIIIVDDASEIPVSNLVQTSNFNVQIRIERYETSQGANKARNWGAEISSGDILMFLDDDDSWEPLKIESQLQIFSKDPKVELVYTGRLIVKEDDPDKILYKIPSNHSGNLYPGILYKNLIGVTSSVALTKNLFTKAGGFDTAIPARQDYDLWIRCSKLTLVEHDNSYNLRYTIANQASSQTSGKYKNHEWAVQYLLNKYSQDIQEQGYIKSRNIRASLFFAVSKSVIRSNYFRALFWSLKSFIEYPNLKSLIIFLPDWIINLTRNRISRNV